MKAQILRCLDLDLDYSDRLPLRALGTQPLRSAAVLMLFSSLPDGDAQLCLTVRAPGLASHPGQISFPGGVLDVLADASRESPENGALREAKEELELNPEHVTVLGRLPPLETVTGFGVIPVVGWLEHEFSAIPMSPSPDEVVEVFWVKWSDLLLSHHHQIERREYPLGSGQEVEVHVFLIGQKRIWGATASMIKNLLDRWKKIEPILR